MTFIVQILSFGRVSNEDLSAYPFQLSISNKGVFLRCSWCRKNQCFIHFFDAFHYCIDYADDDEPIIIDNHIQILETDDEDEWSLELDENYEESL